MSRVSRLAILLAASVAVTPVVSGQGLESSSMLTPSDDCEGCQVHNLFCEEGTGKMHGFSCPGHFAEYSVSDYRNAMVLPKGMNPDTSAPLFCAGVTGQHPSLVHTAEIKGLTNVLSAYHAIRGCGLREGQWIAIVGCGGLGHLGASSRFYQQLTR